MLDTRSYARPASDTIRTLESFDVPFAVFSYDGRQTYLSPEARALLDPSSLQAVELWMQVSRAVRGAPAGARRGRIPAVGAYTATLRPIPDGDPHYAWVAVLRPASAATPEPDAIATLGLTPREADVARLIAGGLSNKEVSAALGISVHTARRHTERVYQKLGVSSRSRVACLLSAREGYAAAVA